MNKSAQPFFSTVFYPPNRHDDDDDVPLGHCYDLANRHLAACPAPPGYRARQSLPHLHTPHPQQQPFRRRSENDRPGYRPSSLLDDEEEDDEEDSIPIAMLQHVSQYQSAAERYKNKVQDRMQSDEDEEEEDDDNVPLVTSQYKRRQPAELGFEDSVTRAFDRLLNSS